MMIFVLVNSLEHNGSNLLSCYVILLHERLHKVDIYIFFILSLNVLRELDIVVFWCSFGRYHSPFGRMDRTIYFFKYKDSFFPVESVI